VTFRTSACDRHRSALVDFIDHRERRPETATALAHLDRCARCEREMTELALTIVALRRMGAGAAAAEPRPDLRPVIPDRRARGRARPALLRASSAGPALSIVVVALVLLPRAFGPAAPAAPAPSPEVLAPPAQVVVRIYDPPAQPLTRAVVAGFMNGGDAPMGVAVPARSVPVARDRQDPSAVPASPRITPSSATIPTSGSRT
jgi:hypothetical protein